jgi:hypothetical protein
MVGERRVVVLDVLPLGASFGAIVPARSDGQPAFLGDRTLDYVCGRCGALLAQRVRHGMFACIVFQLPVRRPRAPSRPRRMRFQREPSGSHEPPISSSSLRSRARWARALGIATRRAPASVRFGLADTLREDPRQLADRLSIKSDGVERRRALAEERHDRTLAARFGDGQRVADGVSTTAAGASSTGPAQPPACANSRTAAGVGRARADQWRDNHERPQLGV